jgi:hypothetical protein
MPYSIPTLLIRNLQDVFGENDPLRRRQQTAQIVRHLVPLYSLTLTPIRSAPSCPGAPLWNASIRCRDKFRAMNKDPGVDRASVPDPHRRLQ